MKYVWESQQAGDSANLLLQRLTKRDTDAVTPLSAKVVSITPDFGHSKIVFTAQVETTGKKIDFTAASNFVLKNYTSKVPKTYEPAVVIAPANTKFPTRDVAAPAEPVVQDVLIKGNLIEYYVQLADKSLARHYSSTGIQALNSDDLTKPRQLSLFMLLFTNGTTTA